MRRAEYYPSAGAEQFHNGKVPVPVSPSAERQLPPARPGPIATSEHKNGIPVIVKSGVVGINAALNHSIRGSGLVDAVKQTKGKQNSMLNKLNKRRGGFTLVEIMIVVAIIALLAAIAVPGFLRARKRSQASRIINDLRLIDSAVDQYAIENNKLTGVDRSRRRLDQYLKTRDNLYNTGKDIFGNDLRYPDRGHAAQGSDGDVQRPCRT